MHIYIKPDYSFLSRGFIRILLGYALLLYSVCGFAQTSSEERQWQEWLINKDFKKIQDEVRKISSNRSHSRKLKHRAQLYIYLSDLLDKGESPSFDQFNHHWKRGYTSKESVYAPLLALYKGLWIENKLGENSEDPLSDEQKMKDLQYMIGITKHYARQEKYSKFGLYSEAIRDNNNTYKQSTTTPSNNSHLTINLLTQQIEYAIYDKDDQTIQKSLNRLDSLFTQSSSFTSEWKNDWDKVKFLLGMEHYTSDIYQCEVITDLFVKMHELSITKDSKTYHTIQQIIDTLIAQKQTIGYPDLAYIYSAQLITPNNDVLKQLFHLSLIRMANYAYRKGSPKTSLAISERVLNELGKNRLQPDHIHYHLQLHRSESFMAENKAEEAIESALNAICIATNIEGGEGILMERGYSFLIDHCHSASIYEEALPFYDKLMEIRKRIMSQQFSILTEEDRNKFWYGRAYDYGFLYNAMRRDSVSHSTKYVTRLADASIFSKQLLLASSKHIEQSIEQSKDPKIVEAYMRLKELRSNYYENLHNSSTRDSIAHTRRYEELRRSEQNLLKLAAPTFNFEEFWNRNWKDVQQKLAPNEVYVDYIRISIRANVNYLVAIMIRPEWDAPKLLNRNHEISIMEGEEQMREADTKTLEDLSFIYFSNIERYLKPKDRVYLSPGGLIHLVPFEILPSNVDGKALADRYDLRRISSFEDIVQAKTPFKLDKIVLIGGLNYLVEDSMRLRSLEKYRDADQLSYLRNSVDEVNYIERIASSKKIQTVKLTESAATESHIKAMTFTPNTVLHIASHAFSNKLARRKNDRKHYRINFIKISGIALSHADEAFIDCMDDNWLGEGFLSTEEIEQLNLRNTELVVLSACNTADGMVNWEGVWGLHRAFKKAGTKSLLVTLWSVNDQVSAHFMKVFYDHLFETQDRHKSFRAAQNIIRSEYPNDPSWAAFIMLD